MMEIEVTEDQLARAKTLSEEMGTLNNSITSGKGNVAGFIGEVVFADLVNAKQCNTYDYDVALTNGKTVDVKTKRAKFKPLSYYECSVAALNTTQKCDYYAFMRVAYDYKKAWFLGIVSKDAYFENSKFLQKGDFDPDNNFVVKSDCYNLSISELWDLFNEEFQDA